MATTPLRATQIAVAEAQRKLAEAIDVRNAAVAAAVKNGVSVRKLAAGLGVSEWTAADLRRRAVGQNSRNERRRAARAAE